MKYSSTLFFICLCSFVFSQNGIEQLKAFPSAYGPGSVATGGRGGDLIIINTNDRNVPLTLVPATENTDKHYVGGLYAALQHPDPAYIIFDRSMTITLGTGGTSRDFVFEGMPKVNNKTIFGQSAPRGGVTITGGTLRFNGRFGDNNNLIFRYLKSRPILNKNGELNTRDDSWTWALLFYGGNTIIVDHCSFSFAQDKALGAGVDDKVISDSVSGNYTFSHNLIEDSHTGYYFEINPNEPEDPENYINNISIIKNVSASVNRTPNMAYSGKGEIINNVAHDIPTKNTTVYHNLKLNHIGNYYSQQRPFRDGVNTGGWNRIRPNLDNNSGNPLIYTSSNYFHGVLTGDSSEDNTLIWHEWRPYPFVNVPPPASSEYFTSNIHQHNFPNPYIPISASNAFNELITNKNVGDAHYLDNNGNVDFYMDDFDLSQLEYIANDDPSYRGHQAENWVLPNMPVNIRPDSYDTDKDGMSDAWEIRVFGDLTQSYNGDCDGDGYTNIEEYYNQVDYGNIELPCSNCDQNIFVLNDPTSPNNESSNYSSNWTSNAGNASLEVVQNASDGDYALKFKALAKNYSKWALLLDNLAPNTEYQLVFDAKSADQTDSKAGNGYVTENTSVLGVHVKNVVYKTYSLKFRTENADSNSSFASKKIFFYPTLNVEAQQKLWIDNIKVIPLNFFGVDDPTNAIHENSSLDNWTTKPNETATIELTDDATQGNQAVLIKSRSLNYSKYNLEFQNLTPGQTYTISFDAKSIDSNTGRFGNSYVALASNTAFGTYITSTTYQNYQFDFQTDDSGNSAIRFYPTLAQYIGVNLYVDNIKVKKSCTQVSSAKASGISNIDVRNKAIDQIKVYPNPVNNILNIEFNQNISEQPTIQIINMLGVIVKEIRVQAKNKTSVVNVNTESLSSGTYFVRVLSNSIKNSPKIFIKN